MRQEEELGLVKKIFIINKQGWEEAGEAAEILMNRRTQASWLPAPFLIASISVLEKLPGLLVALRKPVSPRGRLSAWPQ